MKRYWGLLLSEWVTTAIVVVVAIAVGFGMYVGDQRDSMVAKAEESLAAIKSQLATAVKTAVANRTLLTCDNSLVDAEVLANDYLKLTVQPMPINPANLGEGYVTAVVVESKKTADGNDTFNTARRLYKALDKSKAYTLRVREKDDDEIAFSILVTEDPVCAGSANPAGPGQGGSAT